MFYETCCIPRYYTLRMEAAASLKPQYVPTKLHGLQHISCLKQNCSLYPDVHGCNLHPEVSGGVPQALLANATVVPEMRLQLLLST